MTHPLFLLNFGLFSIFRFHPYYRSKIYDEQFLILSLFIAVTTLVMPLLSVYLLKRFKLISDYSISNSKERVMPYTAVALLLSLAAYKLFEGEILGAPIQFLLATILCIGLNLLINIKFKISSHTLGCGGLTALFIHLSLQTHLYTFKLFIPLTIILSGIVAWSRLYTNAHNEKEVYSGYLLGVASVWGFMYIASLI